MNNRECYNHMRYIARSLAQLLTLIYNKLVMQQMLVWYMYIAIMKLPLFLG